MAPAETARLHRWLAAIGGITEAVNAGRSLEQLLDLVADTARDLLGLDFCAVMLPAADGDSLTIAGASGVPDEYRDRVNQSRRVRLESGPPAGAPASRAFRSGRPCAVSDVAAEPSASWADVAREQGYRSILAVPLVTSTGVVGTLNSYRSVPHDFPPEEIEQLRLLAEHAAIAFTSARILHDVREQHRLIARSEEIADALMGVVLRAGGVTGIATALRDVLGCEVLIRSADGEDHPGLPLPSKDAGRGLVHEDGPHIRVDVVLDGSIVAAVYLLDQAGTLDPLGVRAAEHASVILSLEMLRRRTAAEAEQTVRGELLADLLAGADPAAQPIRDRAHLLGHDLGRSHRMLVARPADAEEPHSAPRAADQAICLTSHLRPRPLIAAVRDLVVALWPEAVGIPAGEDVLRRAAGAATVAAGAATVAVVPLAGTGIPAAYRAARGALALATTGDGPGLEPHLRRPARGR